MPLLKRNKALIISIILHLIAISYFFDIIPHQLQTPQPIRVEIKQGPHDDVRKNNKPIKKQKSANASKILSKISNSMLKLKPRDQYGGIGIVSSLRKLPSPANTQYGVFQYIITVDEVYEGYPAHENGLMPGDMILAVDGTPVSGIELIRGKPGSSSEFLIYRKGTAFVIKIKRSLIQTY